MKKTNKTKNVFLYIRLSERQYQQLNLLAGSLQMNLSELIRSILFYFFKDNNLDGMEYETNK